MAEGQGAEPPVDTEAKQGPKTCPHCSKEISSSALLCYDCAGKREANAFLMGDPVEVRDSDAQAWKRARVTQIDPAVLARLDGCQQGYRWKQIRSPKAGVPAAEENDDDVAAPAAPQDGLNPAGERHARIVEMPPQEAEPCTYYTLGGDHEIDLDDEELHVQCGRVKKIENLETIGPKLKRLMLIANCVEKIEGLESVVNLEHLELYQNLLKKIENISHLQQLTTIDFSFNRIRNINNVDCFPKLTQLYLSSNKIEEIKGVFSLRELKMLELGCNRIRGIPPELGNLVNLEELWLGKNKIISMAMPPLPKLRHLSLQNNRLETWDPALFNNCRGLTHFYLGFNNLPDLPEEMSLLTDLKEIDLAKNAISHIRPLPECVALEELWMNDCQINDLEEVRNLQSMPALKAVYLERNPMHTIGDAANEARYKEAILRAVPDLYQLDAIHLNHTVRVITDGAEHNLYGILKH